MIKAFVFGKFLPFHKGHEAMINFALTKCDKLTVLVCCSDQEIIPDLIRKEWIEKTFSNIKNIDIQILNYLEELLPSTSESSVEISKIWSEKLKELFPDYSLVITSEPYGDYVSKFMNIKHIPFDMKREKYPISATEIRKNHFVNWSYLPDVVKPYFTQKIVILGTESTGKTVLANDLAKHFNASLVTEAGREMTESSYSFKYEDLNDIAKIHSEKIEKAINNHKPLVIIDTDVHITMSYAEYKFNKKLEIDSDIYSLNKADLYLYLNNDVEFIQDGTRLNEHERNLLDFSHRRVLEENNISFHEITGNWDKRFEDSIKLINDLVVNKSNFLKQKFNINV